MALFPMNQDFVDLLRAFIAAEAAGYPIVTRAELAEQYDVKDDIGFVPGTGSYVAFG